MCYLASDMATAGSIPACFGNNVSYYCCRISYTANTHHAHTHSKFHSMYNFDILTPSFTALSFWHPESLTLKFYTPAVQFPEVFLQLPRVPAKIFMHPLRFAFHGRTLADCLSVS